MKSKNFLPYFIILIYFLLLFYPLSINLTFLNLQGVNKQPQLPMVNNVITATSHPANNPDLDLYQVSENFPTSIPNEQKQYGQFNITVFTINVDFPEKTPFEVVNTDNKSNPINYGILNSENISLSLFVVRSTNPNQIVEKISDYFLLTNESTILNYNRSYNLQIKKPQTLDFVNPILNQGYNIFFSLKETFYLNNRTASSNFGTSFISWSNFVSTLSIPNSINLSPLFVVQWSNIIPVIFDDTISIALGVIIVISFVYYYKKYKSFQ